VVGRSKEEEVEYNPERAAIAFSTLALGPKTG
jgi:hypothetical protein